MGRCAAPVCAAAVAHADEIVARMDRFVEAIEVQIARWTAALHVFQLFMMGLAILLLSPSWRSAFWCAHAGGASAAGAGPGAPG